VRTLAAIKSLFGFCIRMRYLAVSPAEELALPAYEDRLAERILAEEDIQRVLAAETEPRNRVLLRLLYAAGFARVGSLPIALAQPARSSSSKPRL
jgi:site-specific recombinase XerD